MSPTIILWIIVAVLTLTVDIATSLFIFVWFTLGAVTAIIASLLGYSFMVQVVTFLLVSLFFVAVGYPLVRRTIKRTVSKLPTTEQGYIGREFTVEEEIIDKATIKIDGIYWTVKNCGEPVKQGERVRVTGIEGNKLIITRV